MVSRPRFEGHGLVSVMDWAGSRFFLIKTSRDSANTVTDNNRKESFSSTTAFVEPCRTLRLFMLCMPSFLVKLFLVIISEMMKKIAVPFI